MRFLILFAVLISLNVEAKTISVSGNSQLRSALSQAKGGDVVSLAPGNYTLNLNGTMSASSYIHYGSEVVITSASSSNRAVFTDVRLLSAYNMTFKNLIFRSNTTDDSNRLVEIKMSKHVHFLDSQFIGKTSGGYGRGYGFYHSTLSTDIQIVNSTFTGFRVGAAVFNVSGFTLRDSQFSNIGYDVLIMNFIYNGLIQNNRMEKRARPDVDSHADLIQLANDGRAEPSRDLTIRGNKLYASDSNTHGIYLNNENAGRSGNQSDYYRNFLIENNIVNNSQVLGVSVGHTIGLTVRNNDVQQMSGVSGGSQPAIRVSYRATGVSITGNTSSVKPTAANSSAGRNWQPMPNPSSWVISGNTIVPKR